jgi:hypothetical protein
MPPSIPHEIYQKIKVLSIIADESLKGPGKDAPFA